MPGQEIMTNLRGRRKMRFWLPAAILACLLAWALNRPAAEANRHQLAPPTRSLPSREERNAFEALVPTRDLVRLLADGRSEGVTESGARVTLALDEDLQREIFSLFCRFDPPYGVFAAMEPDTGRVVALVGYRKGGEADPALALKAIYPAASLFKVVTAAAALEKGSIAPADEISYRGGIYSVTRGNIHARDGRGVPTMSFEEAIAKSANSVFGKVAVNYVGSESLREYMEKFGFGQPIPFVLPMEASRGEIPSGEYDLARTGAGFGEVYVSPLHVAMIMSALGAGGEMPMPVLIERVEDDAGTVLYEDRAGRWRDTVKPETAQALLRMMVKTIETGTSRRTFGTPERTPLLQDMEVAGKTGSLSGWNPRMHFEWFAGVAPVEGPRLALAALVVNNGRWKIKGSYVGKEAFNAYFGYPSSTPPVYAKARAKKSFKKIARHKKAGKKVRAIRKRATKSKARRGAERDAPSRTGTVSLPPKYASLLPAPGRAVRG